MTPGSLFFEGIEEAAKELARHYPGGAKELAHRLRPNKSISAAHTWWLDCCNVNRTEHNFEGDDWLALIRIGREIGCHAVMYFICDEASYQRPQAIEPQNELATMVRQYLTRRERDGQQDRRLELMLANYIAEQERAKR